MVSMTEDFSDIDKSSLWNNESKSLSQNKMEMKKLEIVSTVYAIMEIYQKREKNQGSS